MKPENLARVELAVDARKKANEDYVAAVVAAHEAGESISAIARAAGVSRQAVMKTLRRPAE